MISLKNMNITDKPYRVVMQKQYETIQQNYKDLITSKTYIDKLKASLSSKKVSPKNVSPKKVSPKKVSPKNVSPKKVSSKKVSPVGVEYRPNY
jgi:hypothetical protein